MKRLIAGIAVAAAAAVFTATPAQAAAPANPVQALRKQFVAGKGVKFTERTTMISGSRKEIVVRRSGSLLFSKSGIAASDVTGRFNISKNDLPEDAPEILLAMAKPERTIRIGSTSYTSGGMFSAMLPEDKTWFKAPKGVPSSITGVYGQIINVAEPKTLAAVLKTAKPGTGGTYSGTISYGALYKVSPSLRAAMPVEPTMTAAKQPVTWKLTLNGKSLAERLVTSYPAKTLDKSLKKEIISIDTRYVGWGSKITITAPPADEVTSKLDLEGTDTSEIPLPDVLKGIS